MTNRYLIAKDGKLRGRQMWGVFDDELKQFVERGFTSKSLAVAAAKRWNGAA